MGISVLSFLLATILQSSAYTSDAANYNPPKPTDEATEYQHKYDSYSYHSGENPYGKGYSYSSSYIRNPVPLTEEFTYERLIDVIQQKKLTTIESVIEQLPDYMKNDNYVIMYRSRSLQEASPQSPRAIVYTPTASFIVTFNGGKKNQRGANTLELIQFRHDQQRFEFRELTFDGQNLPKASEANPKKCLECHQSPSRKDIDPRPNWEPYSTWLGAFGSDGGYINRRPLRDTLTEKKKYKPQDKEALDEQADEFFYFKNYVDVVAPKHPRFSKLGKLSIRASVAVTEQLTILNLMRVTRLMMADKKMFPLYKETINAFARCGSMYEQIPNSTALQWHASYVSPYYEYSPYAVMNSTSSFITQIMEPLGIDTSDWSTDFGNGGRLAFYERFGTPSNTHNIFRFVWERLLPELRDASQGKSCGELYGEALPKIDEAFKNGVQQQMQIEQASPPVKGADVMGRCIKCHVDGTDGFIPFFPFNQTNVMAPLLEKPYSKRGTLFDEILYRTSDMAVQKDQMPPSRRLSAEERDALIEYLKEMK